MEEVGLIPHPFEVQRLEKSEPSSPEENAIFMAAEMKDAEVIENLLKRNVDPNVKDRDGRPLLLAILSSDCSCPNCIENIESCLAVLLSPAASCDSDTNAVDGEGRTAVHIAANNQLENCVSALIQHGANIYAASHDGRSALEIIAMKNTEAACRILDRSISIESGHVKNENCTVKVDFGPVMGFEDWSEPQAEMKLLWKLLNECGNTSGPVKIFTHPAVQIFLHKKWTRMLPQIIYGCMIYFLWLILYTAYVTFLYDWHCPVMAKALQTSAQSQQCALPPRITSMLIPLFTLTATSFLWNVMKLICSPKLYFRMRLNIFGIVILLLELVTYVPALSLYATIPGFYYQIAAFNVFLAWAFAAWELGKFPKTGQYKEMFSNSLQKEAEISLASRQIATCYQLECFFYVRGVPHCMQFPYRKIQYLYWKMTSAGQSVEPKQRGYFTFRPNDPEDSSVPEYLKQAALEVAMSWQPKTTECPKKKYYELQYH